MNSRELRAGGATFVLSVILVSQVKSYYRARGREKEGPRTVLSLHDRVWSPESWCWHSGSQRGGGDLGEAGVSPFLALQMELTKQ